MLKEKFEMLKRQCMFSKVLSISPNVSFNLLHYPLLLQSEQEEVYQFRSSHIKETKQSASLAAVNDVGLRVLGIKALYLSATPAQAGE